VLLVTSGAGFCSGIRVCRSLWWLALEAKMPWCTGGAWLASYCVLTCALHLGRKGIDRQTENMALASTGYWVGGSDTVTPTVFSDKNSDSILRQRVKKGV